MNNFFNSDRYTEFFNPETNEIWVFGDEPGNITEKTTCLFVGKDPHWNTNSLPESELPVIDGHGNSELQSGVVYVGEKSELCGTTAENMISKFYNFNV